MLKVVSNSSPLIHLAKVDLLNLLHNQFNEILVPRAVWKEAVEEAGDEPDAKAISKTNWIKIQEVSDSPLLTTLSAFLDKGESEAIALAIEIGADLILLDDSDARQAKVIGHPIIKPCLCIIWSIHRFYLFEIRF